MKQTPPAHKSGTAGQIVNDIPKELIWRGTTVYVPPVNIHQEMRPQKEIIENLSHDKELPS